MKALLVKLCWPILQHFESDAQAPAYKASHRYVLIGIGALFLLLSVGSAAAALEVGELAALFPVLVFFSAGLVLFILGTLGSDGAVSRIWQRRK